MKTIPGFHPSGALRASKFVPDKFVEPDRFAIGVLSLDHRRKKKNPPQGRVLPFFGWGRGISQPYNGD
jgi:hypothetical protein